MKHYSRKLRQFNYLLKRIRKIRKLGAGRSTNLIALIKRARNLRAELAGRLSYAGFVKPIAKTAVLLGIGAWSLGATAQTFENRQVNPFGLGVAPGNAIFGHSFGDLDNDGDQDVIVATATNTATGLVYIENVGSAQDPQFDFEEGEVNPFGLEIGLNIFSLSNNLIDFDNDGDLDFIISTILNDGDNADDSAKEILYFENVGSPEEPSFAEAESGLFGLEPDGLSADIVDLDQDGDFDVVHIINVMSDISEYGLDQINFVENIGSASEVMWAESQQLQIEGADSLVFAGIVGIVAAGDVDADGDVDLLYQTAYGADLGVEDSEYYGAAVYYENNGSGYEKGRILNLEGSEPIQEIPTGISLVDLDGDGDLDLMRSEYIEDTYEWTYYENTAPLIIDTGIASQIETFTVTPNPFSSELFLIDIEPNSQVVLFDLTGRNLGKYTPENQSIVLNSLEAGAYILLVESPDGSISTARVIKQ